MSIHTLFLLGVFMVQLICIFVALISGYLCKKLPLTTYTLNKLLLYLIITILFIMGYNFGSIPDFLTVILPTSKLIGVFSLSLIIFNFIIMTIYAKLRAKVKDRIFIVNTGVGYLSYALQSIQYLIYIICGIMLGFIIKIPLLHLGLIVNLILLAIMFIIGIQLREQSISLKAALINKTGIITALLILLSSNIAGLFAAKLMDLSFNLGLVLSSGFGWYTLSGILAGQLINPQIGAAAFFIDFFREIMAIILIPLFAKVNPLFCIGYSGSTALDFTLPIIKVNLGEEFVPLAISSGMILTISVPIIIPVFAGL